MLKLFVHFFINFVKESLEINKNNYLIGKVSVTDHSPLTKWWQKLFIQKFFFHLQIFLQ